jgi:hypothetical protein
VIYFFGLFFTGARCDNALPAAILEGLLVRRSRNTFEAALPALELVFRWAMMYLFLSAVFCTLTA